MSKPASRRRTRVRFAFSFAFIVPALLTLPFTPALADDGRGDGHAHEHPHDEHGATETIVVTASPLEHDRDELSKPVDIVKRDELLRQVGSTLGETLTFIPGITTSGFAAGASRPVIRGQDAYRTEVLEDGLRTHDVSRESPDHAVPVNPLAAKRIEVVRGPAVLRYGGGASAGVVNVITERVPDSLSDAPVGGDLFGAIGLVADERDLAVDLGGSHGEFAWHADGVLRRFGDYRIPNDDRPHQQNGSQVESWTGSVGGAWIGESARVGVAYIRAENVYGIPEEGEAVEIDMHTDRARFEIDLNDPLPGVRAVRVRGVYSDYAHDEIADGAVGQRYRNEEFDGRLELLHEPLAGFTGALGFQGQTRDYRGGGEAAEFLAPSDTTTAAIYLFEELPIGDALNLETGFRYEHTRVEGTDATDRDRDRRFDALSGALGLVATPTDLLTVGVNASANQRAPSQVELYARGAHEATGTFEIGDPRLDEETSFTGELRVQVEPTRGRFETAVFVTQYDDYIFAGLTGATVDEDGNPVPATDPDALDALTYRNRDALFYGFELQGDVDALLLDCGKIVLDGRFDYVRARFDSNVDGGRRNVPRITPIRWGGGVSFVGDSTTARVGFRRNERQDRAGPFESETDAYTYLDASLSQRVELGEVPLELSVVGRNLNDVRGRNHVAFNKDEVILPGWSLRFGVRASF